MKKIIILVFLVSILSCEKDPVEPITVNKLTGYVQKGPYVNGTSISLSELDINLNQTGRLFTSQITDNRGTFELDNIALSSNFVEIKAEGFYFNEIIGETSLAQLTLYCLSDLRDKSSVNINIITHLEKNRVRYLLDHSKSFSEAKAQAQEEILSIFSIELSDENESELLDISLEGEKNAALLAISLILQGDRTVGELSELLADIGLDIEEDGVLDLNATKSALYASSSSLDVSEIRKNLESRYSELGIQFSAGNFEMFIDAYANRSIRELLDDGISVEGLVEAGVSISLILEAGVNVSDLFEAGVFIGTLQQAGATDTELIEAGLMGYLSDPDGRDYKWIRIGEQVWMAEDYAYMPYLGNGIWVFGIYPHTISPDTINYVYDIEAAKQSEEFINRGCLYNLSAARDNAPQGWHLPTHEDWLKIERLAGLPEDQINLMYDASRGSINSIANMFKSTTGWRIDNELSNGNGTNDFGLNIKPSGWAGYGNTEADPAFSRYEETITWTKYWVSDEPFSFPMIRGFDYGASGIFIEEFYPEMGLRCRYIKDEL